MWRDLVSAVAPTLGLALGGPLGAAAGRVIAGVVTGKEDAGEKEIAAAISGASPEVLAALKKADQDFAERMKELDIDLERIHQADRSSAREREARTGDSWTPRVLAAGVCLGFFAIVGVLLWRGAPDNGGDALLILLGMLGTAFGSIVAYYFGSSAGSAAKNALLGRVPENSLNFVKRN